MSTSRCEDVLLLLPGQAAGGLTREEDARVRAHLQGCAACRLAAASEALLHEGLVKAVEAVPGAVDVRALVARARAREQAELSRPSRRRFLRGPRLLAAASLLLAVALLTQVEPRCLLGDCPTKALIMDALVAAPTSALPPDLGVPALPGLERVGVARLSSVGGGAPVGVYARQGTTLLVFREASAHTHFWYGRHLEDGRKYLVMTTPDGRHLLGWVGPGGQVWCCVGGDAREALALASELRQLAS
ncbi:MAG: zf-HC2 domain-containing protein [Planctomycetes bacterium]|nr:zf-HC2 domain-containing protein [Planctomycetota bacterium]